METTRKILQENLRGRAAIRAYVRFMLGHPFFILLLLCAPILKLLGFMTLEFPYVGLLGDQLLYAVRIGLFCLALYVLFPAWLYWHLSRNIPYLVSFFGFFFVLSSFSAVVMELIMPIEMGPLRALDRFLRQEIMALLLTLLNVFYFENDIRKRIGHNPDLVPVWRGVTLPHTIRATATRLDPGMGGTVLSIRSQNQYVLVETDCEKTLLRMGFSKAVAQMGQSGLRIHRTCWVSHDWLAQLTLERDRLVTRDGRTYPIGRSHAATVRAAHDAALEMARAIRTKAPSFAP